MKNLIKIIIITFLIVPNLAFADLASNNSGMILLQVEENGEAWYAYPEYLKRYYLGRPADAFQVMRELGLGIKHIDLANYLENSFPEKLSGLIMLDVEANGEAYYVYPKDLKGYYLGRPADAFQVMREKGLGITNNDLVNVPVPNNDEKLSNDIQVKIDQDGEGGDSILESEIYIEEGNDEEEEGEIVEEESLEEEVLIEEVEEVVEVEDNYSQMEKNIFDVVNNHRNSIGVDNLSWNNDVADIARKHSVDMSTGAVAANHEGFEERLDAVELKVIEYSTGAENLAFILNYSDPAQTALDSWLTSLGHKANLEENVYDVTGIGVSRDGDGKYYITQLFVDVD